MSFSDRLIHSLVIVRTPRDDDVADRDEYGQPVELTPIETPVSGLVQPKGGTDAGEVALVSQAGVELSDHTIYLHRVELTGADYIRFEPDDGRRYEVVGIDDHNYGTEPHFEVRAKLVGPGQPVEVGS